jgi:hypothetical protein
MKSRRQGPHAKHSFTSGSQLDRIIQQATIEGIIDLSSCMLL